MTAPAAWCPLRLTSAIRLTLLEALSAAADETTRGLAPGSVEVRLRAGEATFAGTLPVVEPPTGAGSGTPEPEELAVPDDDSAMVASTSAGRTTTVNILSTSVNPGRRYRRGRRTRPPDELLDRLDPRSRRTMWDIVRDLVRGGVTRTRVTQGVGPTCASRRQVRSDAPGGAPGPRVGTAVVE